MLVGVLDELFEVGDFGFTSHVVERALCDTTVRWVFCVGWWAVIDIKW